MKTTYATMIGNICLDKGTDLDGNPAPVTFDLRQIQNGQLPWQGKRIRRDYATVKEAMKELYAVFLLEMEERGYEFRNEFDGGRQFVEGYGTIFIPGHPAGWYDTNNPSDETDYPTSEYPGTESEWMEHKITGYAYDNYKVLIVTSNGDVVY